jgi:hypothetical protein
LKKNYSVIEVVAKALPAGQPEVVINFTFKCNATGAEYMYGVQSQIRWSYGKFYGNPESKFYRYGKWTYTELPCCTVL